MQNRRDDKAEGRVTVHSELAYLPLTAFDQLRCFSTMFCCYGGRLHVKTNIGDYSFRIKLQWGLIFFHIYRGSRTVKEKSKVESS